LSLFFNHVTTHSN